MMLVKASILLLMLVFVTTIFACSNMEDSPSPVSTPTRTSNHLPILISLSSSNPEEWDTYKMQVTDGYWHTLASQWDKLLVVPPSAGFYYDNAIFDLMISKKTFIEDGTGAEYREIKIPQDSFSWTDYMDTTAGWMHYYFNLREDGIGRFYVSGGDVDVTSVSYDTTDPPARDPFNDPIPAQYIEYSFGDGNIDPPGSLLILVKLHNETYLTDSPGGEVADIFSTQDFDICFTTATSLNTVDSSVKGRLSGRSMPDPKWDRIGLVDNIETHIPDISGEPMDDLMNGTWVGVTAAMNQWFSWGIGALDIQTEERWIVTQR